MTRRLALVVGDTAGHINPALAVADEYRAMWDEVDVLFLAADGGPAADLVPAAGYDLALIPALPLARAGLAGKLAALSRVMPCLVRARRILIDRGSRLTLGSGGYASGSVLLAARSLALQTGVIEPNVEIGLANRLLRRVARRAYVSHPAAAAAFPAGRALLTGTPVRRSLSAALRPRRWDETEPARILITSGSRGDDFLAERVPPMLAGLEKRGVRVEVFHQSAAHQVDTLRQHYHRFGLRATVVARLDSMAAAYNWATFAIARAGAGTLAELALSALPALLVPLADAAADHQAANAQSVAEAGAAIWIRERQWRTEDVVDRVAPVLSSAAAWGAMSACARRIAAPDAARRIVEDCESVMEGRW